MTQDDENLFTARGMRWAGCRRPVFHRCPFKPGATLRQETHLRELSAEGSAHSVMQAVLLEHTEQKEKRRILPIMNMGYGVVRRRSMQT